MVQQFLLLTQCARDPGPAHCSMMMPVPCPQGAQRASTSMTERVTTRAAASSGAAWSSDPKPSSRNMGVILEKSPINSTPVRLLALLAAVTLGGVGTSFLPASAAAAVVHVLAAGTWVGINLWTTFFAGITMFKNLERQTFGKLQAKLFPLYFALTTFCCAILLGTSTHFESVITNKVTGTLILGLVTSLANLVFIEPKATSVMFERYQLENSGSKDPEARKKLTSQFGARLSAPYCKQSGVLVWVSVCAFR